MIENSIAKRIENEIQKKSKSKIYSFKSFRDLDNYDNIRKILSRMVKKGKLIRVARGFYKPVDFNKFLNEEVAINIEEFIKAYSKAYKLTIAPCGNTALNILGLSTQVPNIYCFITDGPSKKISLLDGRKIQLKHRTLREISGLNYKEATLVEALKFIGKENINEKIEKIIIKNYSSKELMNLKTKTSQSRNWIYQEINKLSEMKRENV